VSRLQSLGIRAAGAFIAVRFSLLANSFRCIDKWLSAREAGTAESVIASVLFGGLILTLIRLELTQVIGLLSEDAGCLEHSSASSQASLAPNNSQYVS